MMLKTTLNEISHFIREYSAVEPLPWKHEQERCFRTVYDVSAPDVIPPKFEGIRHTAKAEALLRVRWLHRMLRN